LVVGARWIPASALRVRLGGSSRSVHGEAQ